MLALGLTCDVETLACCLWAEKGLQSYFLAGRRSFEAGLRTLGTEN